MKIYLVTDGEYSDFCVVGAFSTLEKAERGKILLNTHNDIEEFDLDCTPESPPGKLPYRVSMKRDGGDAKVGREAIVFFKVRHSFSEWDGGNKFYAYVYAKDEDHAIKIANEKRIMELARE